MIRKTVARRIIVTGLLAATAALALTGCGTSKPGEPGVYDTIDATTNCVTLQSMFDSFESTSWRYVSNGDARSKNTIAYGDYTLARMGTLKCNG